MYGTIPYIKELNKSNMTTAARLDLRLNLMDKNSINRAAQLRGVAVAAFVRDAALRESERVIASEHSFVLSVAESKHFLSLIDAPFAANAKLKKALSRVRR